MKCVAIIPARGGSKGLVLKNLRKIGGERLVVRAVKAALESALISHVYVSTDCPEIAHVSRNAGARVIARPTNLSEDECSSESAIQHVLSELGKNGEMPDFVAFLQCTSPFTTPGDITNVLQPLLEGRAESTFLAVPSHGFLWRSNGSDGGATGINHDHLGIRQRRQDREPEYRETGAAYGFGAADFLKQQNRFIGRVMAVESRSVPFDIDDMRDLLQANDTVQRAKRTTPNRPIKALVTDFDGVHTDGKVAVSEDGTETVRCSRRDGMGIEIARKQGLPVLILSKEKNPVVEMRARKLRVECIHGCDDKLSALSAWLREKELHWDDIAYVGDDINDLDCLQLAGLSICPADGVGRVKSCCDLHLNTAGGEGCVREVIDYIGIV
ncbi:acylneuraminate cytidylyltransferase [Luteolibacter yonseiensis]|uniref:N-acylneuraminate cytidylyltransferase n=1 Tax=Luteolibacter yonseiensis TaxID=1144680 RepID=A0A934R4T1_9BACT|nr:acylneuraminate cytidylyltransferase [Luteolibacter yonseiensis]MBK1816377.1 acylneuraminate cytidylyltransferase [Luteolibacter yonseiensis]